MYEIKDTIEEVYRLPFESGYKLVNEAANKSIVNSHYECGNKTVDLIQYTKLFAENMMANTENSTVCEIEVNGDVGFMLYHQSKNSDNISIITWVRDGYVFEIMGTGIDGEELLKLAEIIEIE